MNSRENTGKVGKGNPPVHSRFKKGQTGNPNGRPKKLPDLKIMLAEVLGNENDDKPAALAILKALQKKAARGDVRAAELLFDRAWGKVKQSMEFDGKLTLKIGLAKEEEYE